MRTAVGVDPGIGGAIAVIHEDGAVELHPMPRHVPDLINLANRIASLPHPHAVVEKLTGYVGGQGNPGSGMFKLGVSYGRIEAALVAAGIPCEYATPQRWQTTLGIPPRRKKDRTFIETKPEYKRRLRAVARQMFPSANVTLQTADSLLIAEYCRRVAS